jgi:hypothetical protein
MRRIRRVGGCETEVEVRVTVDRQDAAVRQQRPTFLVVEIRLAAVTGRRPRHRLAVEQRRLPAHLVGEHVGAVLEHDARRVADRMRGERGARRIQIDEERRRRHRRPAVRDRIVDGTQIGQQEVVTVVRIFTALDDHATVR